MIGGLQQKVREHWERERKESTVNKWWTKQKHQEEQQKQQPNRYQHLQNLFIFMCCCCCYYWYYCYYLHLPGIVRWLKVATAGCLADTVVVVVNLIASQLLRELVLLLPLPLLLLLLLLLLFIQLMYDRHTERITFYRKVKRDFCTITIDALHFHSIYRTYVHKRRN